MKPRRLNGADYVAVKRLSNLANETLAEEGQTCEAVPAESLVWLKEQGLIRKAQPGAGPTEEEG
jgi:hypothetical protein